MFPGELKFLILILSNFSVFSMSYLRNSLFRVRKILFYICPKILPFTIKYLIHLEIIFIHSVKYGSNFFFLFIVYFPSYWDAALRSSFCIIVGLFLGAFVCSIDLFFCFFTNTECWFWFEINGHRGSWNNIPFWHFSNTKVK